LPAYSGLRRTVGKRRCAPFMLGVKRRHVVHRIGPEQRRGADVGRRRALVGFAPPMSAMISNIVLTKVFGQEGPDPAGDRPNERSPAAPTGYLETFCLVMTVYGMMYLLFTD
jgi:hypothetical protein